MTLIIAAVGSVGEGEAPEQNAKLGVLRRRLHWLANRTPPSLWGAIEDERHEASRSWRCA
jgi:hypothetical protein